MAALTILQMIQKAEAELGLPVGTAGFAGGVTDRQMCAMANRCLDELRRMNRWTALQFEFNIDVPVALQATGNMAPASAVITNISPTTVVLGLTPNDIAVSGTGIPQAARIASVDSDTQITMTMLNTNEDAVVGADLAFATDTFEMPTGFDFINNRTMWDRTNFWELLGPDSPQMDQWQRSGIVVTGPRRHFRQVGPYAAKWRIWPPPLEITEPLQLVYEYLSIDAVLVSPVAPSTIPTFQQYFDADAQYCLLDDNALIMGMKWMFWEVKGFNFVPMQNRWIDYVNRLIARDGGAKTLQINKRENPIFISPANVQDGFFPGPSGST